MRCKYCGKPLPEGIHGKQEYCDHAHRQAYYREKLQQEQQEQQEGIEQLKGHFAALEQEIEQLKAQVKDQEEEISQQREVIYHLKVQMNLEQRYLNDTQARGFLAFIRKRPLTPLIEKFLADRGLFDRGGHWYYECRVRFVYNGSDEEILEFKDLWKLLILESSRDDS